MSKKMSMILLLGTLFLFTGCSAIGTLNHDIVVDKTPHQKMSETKVGESMEKSKAIKEIYLAGGCFWGLEAYFSRIDGVEVRQGMPRLCTLNMILTSYHYERYYYIILE